MRVVFLCFCKNVWSACVRLWEPIATSVILHVHRSLTFQEKIELHRTRTTLMEINRKNMLKRKRREEEGAVDDDDEVAAVYRG